MMHRIETIKDKNGNDVKVIGELADFYNTLKLKNPMLIAEPINSLRVCTRDEDNNEVFLVTRLNISTLKSPSMFIGSISYQHKVYKVTSRLIRNNKFAHWNRDEYHAKSSVHMKNMVKVALDNIIPLTIDEIYEASNERTSIGSDIREIRDSIAGQVKTNLSKVDNATWFEELLNMHSSGYTPKSDRIKQLIDFTLSKKEEYDENYSYDPLKLFVYIEDNGIVKTRDSQSVVKEYPDINALPEDILGKVTVLMVTPEKCFVRGIGKKDSNNRLWVLL